MQTDLTSPVSKAANSRQGTFKVAVVAATLVTGLLMNGPAQAFNLGNLTTLSALGEPLQLEYEVLDLSPAEAATLRVSLASPQDFATRGLVYGPALEGLRLGLVGSVNSRLVIRMEGQRPAADPFVDLLLNITWASGATTRSVSVLLAPTTAATTAAELPRAPVGPDVAAAVVPPSALPALPALTPQPESREAATGASTAPSTLTTTKTATSQSPSSASPVVAQTGDTAGELAQRERPTGVEQSQYLLALVEANPRAFVEGNVNRLLAGARLDLPTQAQATATPAAQARQIIAAQWQAFQSFRQQTALKPPTPAPSVPTVAPGSGPQAQGQVDSLAAAAQAPAPADKLTLSKPSAQGVSPTEQALLDERQAKEANARLEELTRSLRELNQLQAAGPTADAASPTTPTTPTTPPSPVALPAVNPQANAQANPNANAALVDQLADHPAVLPVAGSLLALALAWLGLRLRRKVPPEQGHAELDLELDLDEAQWRHGPTPTPTPAPAPAKAAPTLDTLMDFESATQANKASHS